ncbi:hypothetical protein [Pseudomonas sp. UFMG81]|uniref:hypothetical protein n=1 Tax=Pseudomonas sp. UFMG81 TaxID=2745936 RepID=UPI00188FD4DD|nr:hypothetical protein [Pseudomonas sp. UFMG81]
MSQASSTTPPTDAGLQQFLSEEVTAAALGSLMEKAQAARSNRQVVPYSGNAYHVAFEDEGVLIGHHYVKDWQPLRVPLDKFIAALEAWKEQPGP